MHWRAVVTLVAQLVKNRPAMQETWVWSLVWEDPLKKGKATLSSVLAWRIPWTCMYSPVHFSSVAQLCPTLCDLMDCSAPGLPVHYQLPEFTQTHAHWVSDAIQPSHPLSSPSPPAFNLSQHQGLFKWVSSSHQVVKVLEFQFSISPSNECSGLISLRMD